MWFNDCHAEEPCTNVGLQPFFKDCNIDFNRSNKWNNNNIVIILSLIMVKIILYILLQILLLRKRITMKDKTNKNNYV